MDVQAQLIQELRESFKSQSGDRRLPLGISKATTVNTATGLVNYDLQIPSKNAYPVNTPIRKVLPRVNGEGDTATRWKVVSSITGSGYDSMGYVPEGVRSAVMTIAATPKAAVYTTIGEEANLTYEAWSAAEGFEDEKARTTIRLLQKMWLKEEAALLGGNLSLQLGTATAPTVTTALTGGTVAAGTYHVQVAYLTMEGYLQWIKSGALIATGIPTQLSITSAVGESIVINGGTSQVSAATAGTAITGSPSLGVINASTPAKTGAVAYAWFIDDGASGAKTLQAVTLINSYSTTTTPTTTGQNATAISSDHSYNNFNNGSNVAAMDGLVYAAYASAAGSNTSAYLPGAYVNHLATGTPGVGTKLTASGRGTVNEIDAALLSMWNNYQVSPTVIYVNAQQLGDIAALCLTNSSGPLLFSYKDPSNPYQLAAGGIIEFYFNPYTQDGGVKIPIKIHPFLPAGVILLWSETLPPQYMSSEIPNVAEVHIRRDYYQIDWPARTRLFESGVYAEETVAVYAPFAMGVIDNIAPGV